MAQSKTDMFSEEEKLASDFAKALSHPARVKILKILAEKNVCICGDIVEVLPLAQSTVSQHLKELKDMNLITGEIEGPRTCYCINSETLRKVRDTFNKLFSNIGCCK